MGKYAKSLKDSLTVEEFIEDLISEGYNKDEILDTVKGQIVRIEEYEYILTKPYLVDKCIENNSYRPRITKLKDFLQEDNS